MGSALNVPDEKLLTIADYATSPLFDDTERLALEYADRITLSDRDVDDAFFEKLRTRFGDAAVLELTEIITWENASSKFNRTLRIGSQGLWKRRM